MKNLFIVLIFLISSGGMNAQTPYISAPDPEQPGGVMLKGIISKYIFINDTSCHWYPESQQIFSPKEEVIKTMAAAKGKYRFLIFGGSWCEDTHFVLPKFFMLQEKSGIPDSDICLIGVDRNKQSPGNLSRVFDIQHVPTIIVLKDGMEVGRVVEYGKTGQWDAELASFLK